jgi:hypothetical protein
MKKENYLLNKVKCLLKRIGAPKYLNKYGPKKYTLAEKVYDLFLRSEWKSSFRKTVRLCNNLDILCTSKSTLSYTLNKLPWIFIKNMLKATVQKQTYLAAIDSTGISRNRLSEHYTLRAGIEIKKRKATKLSTLIDTRTKKILSARFRKKYVHDIRDVKYLLNETPVKPKKITADKAYDAEWFREFLALNGIGCCIPVKKNAKKGFYRKKSICDKRTYNRRSMIESSYFRLKQLYGHSVNCINARAMRAEIYLRLILYNLSIILNTI